MDLRLELRRTNKLVVASPEGDSAFRWYPFPALPCRALDSSVPPELVLLQRGRVVNFCRAARAGASASVHQRGARGENHKGRDCSRPFGLSDDAELLGGHFFGFAFLPHQLQFALGFLEGGRYFLLHAGSGFFEFLR